MLRVSSKEQRKKAIEEAHKSQNIHFIGLSYKDGREKEVYHRQRFVSLMQASNMATFQVMGNKSVSCVNILTDEEYKQYVAQKKEKASKRTKSSWRVPKSKPDV